MKRAPIVVFFAVFVSTVCSIFLNAQNPHWRLKFEDDCKTGNLESKWFRDGYRAKIEYTPSGLLFNAVGQRGDDACHEVLWTKQSFDGDLRVEYDFTRLDSADRDVVIIYLLADGVGTYPFDKDIFKWKKYRSFPYMEFYWRHMNLIHISYAAEMGTLKYVRSRFYPVIPGQIEFKQTEVAPGYDNVNMFETAVEYHINIEKTGDTVNMKVSGNGKSACFTWKSEKFKSIVSGRVGLRQMAGRSSQYKNFKISDTRN